MYHINIPSRNIPKINLRNKVDFKIGVLEIPPFPNSPFSEFPHHTNRKENQMAKRYFLAITIYSNYTDRQVWHCTQENAYKLVSPTCDFIIPLDRKPRNVKEIKEA